MAAGWMTHLAGDQISVYSAGSEPADRINPAAVGAMAEVGIDISAANPRRWTDDMIKSVAVVVTMGCGDTCPVFPGVRYVDWDVDDPAGRSVVTVRPVRDEIKRRVVALIEELGVDSSI